MTAWLCPFCNQHATLTHSSTSTDIHKFNENNRFGDLIVKTIVFVCPNRECQQFSLQVHLYKARPAQYGWQTTGDPIHHWQLVPSSNAKVFPDYVPKAIREDYEEACLIRELSPKSAATLARRALQGIIRDFYGVSKNRLVDEIAEIKNSVDPLTYQAIDAVRQVGNIGAHMEKDINLIIDVEPKEAGLLIGLIEFLLKETYILRHERQMQLQAVIKLADDKKQLKAQSSVAAP